MMQYILELNPGEYGLLEARVEKLLENGLSPETPVCILGRGTKLSVLRQSTSLRSLPNALVELGMKEPVILLINAVEPHLLNLDELPELPLAGRRVVVTRSRKQAGELNRILLRRGAEVIDLPLIEIRPQFDPNAAAEVFAEIYQYDWLVFTSSNGVRYFFELFFGEFEDIRSLGLIRVAALGKATAREISKLRLKVDLIARDASAESLAQSLMEEQTLDNLKILVITGNLNRDNLVRKLDEARSIVDTFQVYETLNTDLTNLPAAASFREKGADGVIFTSSSAVRSFTGQAAALRLSANAVRPVTCSIGPVTSETMRKLGIPVDLESKERSLEGILEALVQRFQCRK